MTRSFHGEPAPSATVAVSPRETAASRTDNFMFAGGARSKAGPFLSSLSMSRVRQGWSPNKT